MMLHARTLNADVSDIRHAAGCSGGAAAVCGGRSQRCGLGVAAGGGRSRGSIGTSNDFFHQPDGAPAAGSRLPADSSADRRTAPVGTRALRVAGARQTYHRGHPEAVVFHAVNLAVETGEICEHKRGSE